LKALLKIIKGKKKPTNENRIYFEDGLVLEAGEVKDNKELENTEGGRIESKLEYNEFIVYDVGQVISYEELFFI